MEDERYDVYLGKECIASNLRDDAMIFLIKGLTEEYCIEEQISIIRVKDGE